MLKKYKNKEKEFIKLYDQYAFQVYRFIYLKTNSAQDAEDLTSEVFFRFWKNLGESRDLLSPKALIYRIANNLIVDFYRKREKDRIIIDSDIASLANIAGNSNLSQKMEFDSDLEQIIKSLDKIKKEYQNVVIWHYLDDLSVQEIAQILGKSENNVRVLTHRALVSLKKVLAKDLKN